LSAQEDLYASDILTILRKSAGEYISGEYLSKCLGISRSAIWKRIGKLKKEGFKIEASTKKGYKLNLLTYPYSKSAILQTLTTHTLGHELKFYEQTDSTNTALKRLAAQGACEGTVIISESQSKGRGRLGRSWVSKPGKGIWMSVLLRPLLHPSRVQSLTLAAAVAVCQALSEFNIEGFGIKWPNDIIIDGRKVCGILTELSAEAERVAWVIVGIGLNVNHLEEDFPKNLKPIATSLRLCSINREPLNRSLLASAIINRLESVYDNFINNNDDGASWLVEEWKKYNATLGKRVMVTMQGQKITATAYDILSDGRLVIKKDDGTILKLLSGEVSLREL
jgi:BirA family biotin operon repressor/biotin-[acetyl-CoA-carboxylase] ligase